MPYSKTSDLPNNVKDPLPASAQGMWMRMFNRAFHSCTKSGGKDCENISRIAAWIKVGKSYKKGADGRWVKKD
jgi:cation transport regulator